MFPEWCIVIFNGFYKVVYVCILDKFFNIYCIFDIRKKLFNNAGSIRIEWIFTVWVVFLIGKKFVSLYLYLVID
jgi:hypothetical protein